MILFYEIIITQEELNNALATRWQLADAGLHFKALKKQPVFELSSDRIFIDEPIANEIQKMCLPKDALLTYFVNGIESKSGKTPYSFVTAIEKEDVFSDIRENRIHISSWLADDLKLKLSTRMRNTLWRLSSDIWRVEHASVLEMGHFVI